MKHQRKEIPNGAKGRYEFERNVEPRIRRILKSNEKSYYGEETRSQMTNSMNAVRGPEYRAHRNEAYLYAEHIPKF